MNACASTKPCTAIPIANIGLLATLTACAAVLCTIRAHADTAADCKKLTTFQVRQLMNIWKAGLASGDADKIASFYTDDATLATTRDAQPVKGKQAIRDYYATLLPRHPQPRFISTKIATTCNAVTVDGAVLYRITGKRKGTRMLLGGRYKVEFAYNNKTWQITNQSLAADPRKLDEPIASM